MKKDPNKWVTLNCGVCGEEFEQYKSTVERYNIRYCSQKCGGIARGKKKELIKNCKACGNEFKYSRSANTDFCSRKCKSDWRRSGGEYKNCKNCSKEYYVQKCQKDKDGGCCSNKCSGEYRKETKPCPNCMKSIPLNRQYCSTNCYNRYTEKYPKTLHLRQKVQSRRVVHRYISGLHDVYIRKICIAQYKVYDPPKELIELKRLNIKRKRKLKEITHGNSQ